MGAFLPQAPDQPGQGRKRVQNWGTMGLELPCLKKALAEDEVAAWGSASG